MKRSLSLINKPLIVVLSLLLTFGLSNEVLAQKGERSSTTAASASKGKKTIHRRKHKKKRRVITHLSDDDKKLKEIKDAKNKERGRK